MTPETWTIIGVGIALAGLFLAGIRGLNARIDRLDERMDRDKQELGERMDRDRKELGVRMDRLESGQGDLRERMAHLEGLLEGLREAIAHNRAA